MATQYIQGIQSVYLNDALCITSETATVREPVTIYSFAESNAGPLAGVKKWTKEPGSITLTLVIYSAFDYTSLLNDNDVFEVSIIMRSGDIITGHSCILSEAPSYDTLNGTIEVSFQTMNIDMDLATV